MDTFSAIRVCASIPLEFRTSTVKTTENEVVLKGETGCIEQVFCDDCVMHSTVQVQVDESERQSRCVYRAVQYSSVHRPQFVRYSFSDNFEIIFFKIY